MTTATRLLLAAALLLGGCASSGTERLDAAIIGAAADAGDEESPERLAATDLVSTLMQLPPLSPFSTTLQLSAPATPFAAALAATLRAAGYGIQRVSTDQGQRHVAAAHERRRVDGRTLSTYSLRVGPVRLARDYVVADGAFAPAGAVRIEGVEPVRVIVNDDVHRQRGGELTFVSGVVFVAADGTVLERREREVQVREASARAAGERVGAERFLVLARANLFLADRLASSAAPDGVFEPLLQIALRFRERGSLRLGDGNKRALARLRAAFDPATDRFVVSGCSHGRSLLWDGTESEALARSQRVKEELVIGGVPSARVREEGCFSTRYGDELPRDTVVATLERRRDGTI